MTDLLVTQVPTELVAPYTAVSAAIVGLLTKPTQDDLHPDQLTAWRWAAFAILIFGTFALVWEGKKRKVENGGGPFPLLEITGALAAAVGWALALPLSPIWPYLHSTAAQTATPLLIGFVAVVVTSFTAAALQGERASAKQTRAAVANKQVGG